MRTTVLKRGVQLTILVLLAITFKSGWNYLQSGGIFPISVVKVQADYAHLSPQELQQAISTDLPASFWTVDIRGLKERLKTISWVESVDIEKVWPETLKIRVNEKKVLARWGDSGFISDKEEIFYPDDLLVDLNDSSKKVKPNLANQPLNSEDFQHLPILYAPDGQLKIVLQQYKVMSEMLNTKQLILQTLLLSESDSWELRLTDGTILLLGREEPLKRLSRFLNAYNVIFNPEVQVNKTSHDEVLDEESKPNIQKRVARRIDLRYPHGMAISWVDESNKTTDVIRK